MFLLSFGDFLGGLGGAIMIFVVILFIIFLCKGGINLNYALGLSLLATSLFATLLLIFGLFDLIKKRKKSGYILLIIAIITGIFGFFVPFQAVFMGIKFTGIFSSLIYEMLLSIIVFPILFGEKKKAITQSVTYFFKNLLPMFGTAFCINVFIVMFFYMGETNGFFKKFVDSGMSYNYIFWDNIRKDKEMDSIILEQIEDMKKLKDNKEVYDDVYDNCKRSLSYQGTPCRTEINESNTISEKNFFRALLKGFKDKTYEETGKKYGYKITNSKELDDGNFILIIVDMKNRKVYYYYYDYDNSSVSQKDRKFWDSYANCSNGVCKYGERE